MTREEFDRIAEENGKKISISDKDYQLIEYVYTYHPCISDTEGKKQIVDLVSTYGMRIIRDMKETADRAKVLEQDILDTRTHLFELSERLKDLKAGR